MGERDWKRLANVHVCTYAKPMDADNNVVKGRGTQGRATWWRGEKGEKQRISVIVSKIKPKIK